MLLTSYIADQIWLCTYPVRMIFFITEQRASVAVTDNQPKQPVIVSRGDLYTQVRVTPMMQLAEQYGISGNGLAKVCKRLVIPVPGRGYWTRKAAGQKVSPAPLPEKPERVPLQVRIAPSLPPAPPPRLSTVLEEKLAAARELTSAVEGAGVLEDIPGSDGDSGCTDFRLIFTP